MPASLKKEVVPHRYNQEAFENGWKSIALPIKPNEKKPVWDGWSNPAMKYDPDNLGYSPEDYDLQGCGVGLRAGLDIEDGSETVVLGLDIDVKDWRLVGEIMKIVRKFLGSKIITREGNAPKVLIPLRVKAKDAAGWKPTPISVGEAGQGFKIEIIYKGKQFVVRGIHPDTGQEYKCSEDILVRGPSCVLEASMDVLRGLWSELETLFGMSTGNSNKILVAANGLKSSVSVDVLDVVRLLEQGVDIHDNLNKLTAALVNDGMDADQVREWLVSDGILGRLPREADRVGDVYSDSSEIGRAITGAALKFGKGSRWEYLHEGLSGALGGFAAAQGEFGAAGAVGGVGGVGGAGEGGDDDDPFAAVSEAERVVAGLVRDAEKRAGASGVRVNGALKYRVMETGFGTPMSQLPPTAWLDSGSMFLRGTIIAMQGKPAASKSTYSLNYLLHLMTGVGGKAFGAEMRTFPDGRLCVTDEDKVAAGRELRVLYLNADDASELIKKRIAAWGAYWNVPAAVMDGLDRRLKIVSVSEGVSEMEIDRPEGLRDLRDLIEAHKVDIVLGDPAANLMPSLDRANDEALGGIKRAITELNSLGVAGCFVIHVRKSANAEGAESTLDDIRGAGAIGGAVRGAFDIRRLSKAECEALGYDPRKDGRRLRLLSHTKNNYGPLADDRMLEIQRVDMMNCGLAQGETQPVLVPFVPSPLGGVSDVDAQSLLDIIVAGTENNELWSDANSASKRSVFSETERLHGWDKRKTQNVLRVLVEQGYVTRGETDVAYGNRETKKGKGLVVHPDKEIWTGIVADCDPFVAI